MTVTEIAFAIVVLLVVLELIMLLAIIVGRSNYRRLKEVGEKDLEELRKRIERIERDRRRG